MPTEQSVGAPVPQRSSQPGPDRLLDARSGVTQTIVDDHRPMSAAQFDDGMQLLLARISAMCEARERGMEDAIKRGVAAALAESLDDEETVKRFWRTGFDELTAHSADGASKWVGRRLLTGFVVAVMIACVSWLVQAGKLK